MAGRYMTDGEIATSYRQAKSKKKQVGILADLNGMTRAEIEDILIAAGYPIKRRTRKEQPMDTAERTSTPAIPMSRLQDFAKTCEALIGLADGPVKLKFDASSRGAEISVSWANNEIYFSEVWQDESKNTPT